MRKFNKVLYQLLIAVSIFFFSALVILQYRDASTRYAYQDDSNQIFDTLYSNFSSYPTLSSLLLAALGFFIISHFIFAIFEKNTSLMFSFNGSNSFDEKVNNHQNQMNLSLVPKVEVHSMPLKSSMSIFDAVIKSELKRLEDEVGRLRENANAIALTNKVIDNLVNRIESIIIETQHNIDNYHYEIPAARTLLNELDLLSVQANKLASSIGQSINQLLTQTDSKTNDIIVIINSVLLSPNEGVLPQVNDYLTEFDSASKLTNILALEQAELAQEVKVQLNQLSAIAKDTNLKSQCIVNSMRDMSNTKQGKKTNSIKHDV